MVRVRRETRSLIQMAMGFFFCRVALQTTMNFSAKLLGGFGSICFATTFAVFSVAGFCAPAVSRNLGPRTTMAVGAGFYALFIGSLIYIVTPAVLISSAVLGVGSAIVWTGQGAYLTQISNSSNRGRFSGIFWSLFLLGALPGNLMSHWTLSENHSKNKLSTLTFTEALKSENWVIGWTAVDSEFFLILFVMGVCGIICFASLPKPRLSFEEKPLTINEGCDDAPPPATVAQQIAATFRMMGNRRILLLAPLMCWSGIELTFWSTWFTRQMHTSQIGLAMTVFATTEFFMGFAWGKIADIFGRIPVAIMGSLFGAGGLILSWKGNLAVIAECGAPGCQASYSDYLYFYLAAFCLALMDGAIEIALTAATAEAFANDAPEAFAVSRTLLAVGACTGFILTNIFGGSSATEENFQIEIYICGLFGWIGVNLFFYFEATYRKPEEEKPDAPQLPIGTSSITFAEHSI